MYQERNISVINQIQAHTQTEGDLEQNPFLSRPWPAFHGEQLLRLPSLSTSSSCHPIPAYAHYHYYYSHKWEHHELGFQEKKETTDVLKN